MEETHKKQRISNRVAELLALKARAENHRITQKMLGEELGIPQSTLARWYHNEIQRFDDEVLMKFMEYFSCGIGDLLIVEEYDDEGQSKTPLRADPEKIPA